MPSSYSNFISFFSNPILIPMIFVPRVDHFSGMETPMSNFQMRGDEHERMDCEEEKMEVDECGVAAEKAKTVRDAEVKAEDGRKVCKLTIQTVNQYVLICVRLFTELSSKFVMSSN